MGTCASTAPPSKCTNRVREQKRAFDSEISQFVGNSRGGKTTKSQAVVDALGKLIHFMLTGDQVHDASVAIGLLSELEIAGCNILGDKAYDS